MSDQINAEKDLENQTKNIQSQMFFRTSNIAKIDGPVSFSYVSQNANFVLMDVDIQLILEFKDIFGRNCPVFPKNKNYIRQTKSESKIYFVNS